MGATAFDPQEYLERAKWGPALSPTEIRQVVEVLQDPRSTQDRYTLIHIVGRSEATEYRELVESFLESPQDPMLARISLQTLCFFWDMIEEYLPDVVRFVQGVDWDLQDGSQVRQIAMSTLGAYLAEHPDRGLIVLLLRIAGDAEEWEPDREGAVFALAYSLGIRPDDMPPASCLPFAGSRF